MKTLKYLCVYMLLVVCLSSCSTKPKNAKECVMQFLECLEKGDIDKGVNISDTIVIDKKGNVKSLFLIAQQYNPHWNPKKVNLFSEAANVVNIGNKKMTIVLAKYGNIDARFYVNTDEKTGSYSINNTDNFLKIYNTAISKKGIKINKGTYCKDINYLYHCTIDVENVISSVENFYKNKDNKSQLYKLYPNSQDFGEYLIIDSVIPNIQDVTINLTNKWELQDYVIQCSDGDIFNVKQIGNDYTIVDSEGLFDFYKKLSDLCTKYDFQYTPEDPDLSTDVNAYIEATKAEVYIRTEAEKLAYQKGCVDYWKRVGLVIKDTRTVRGKDNNNYPTTGVSITLFNPTNKNIKYLEFYTVARNSVDDIIGRERCRGIGPIEPQESVTYSFDNLYRDYNGIINKVSVVSVGITYTDGSRKTAKWSEVSTDSDSSKEFNAYWW